MAQTGEVFKIGLEHFTAPDGAVGSIAGAVQHHGQHRPIQIMFCHHCCCVGMMMLDPVEGKIEIFGIM